MKSAFIQVYTICVSHVKNKLQYIRDCNVHENKTHFKSLKIGELYYLLCTNLIGIFKQSSYLSAFIQVATNQTLI